MNHIPARSREQGLKQHFPSLVLANMSDAALHVAVMRLAQQVATVATKHVA